MNFARTIFGLALCSLSSAPVGSAFAQANNGFVGVFGDAAATIRCMQAAPGVPTTLYVVASAAGTTANGITGAEFRIEFTNSSGYFISYSAPSGAQALGDPLSSAGFNIAWPTCQMPSAGKVQLGTIMVFNAGSGGQTDIIVKRKNPPSNTNYQCALFVHCNSPVYTKSCMTAPSDSVSCLTQKAGSGPTLQSDEFSTVLGGGVADANYKYLGYRYTKAEASCENFEGCVADVIVRGGIRPAGGSHYAAWVGLQNNSAKLHDLTSRWIQSGFTKQTATGEISAYFEYVRHSTLVTDGIPDGWSGVLLQYNVSPGPPSVRFSVKKNGDYAEFKAGPIVESSTVPWTELLEHGGFPLAAWTGEVANDDLDRMPGTNEARCKFDHVRYLKPNSSTEHTPSLSNGNKATPETSHGNTSLATGSFEIWRE